ncbi:UNVERIFIED_CONTAM: Dynein assembly factor 4, axonemal [Siphonaria sp. JEL0065]|nr:Dynein assembly factor 4, axonemal [Siphonaria sp. JEL0065]
MPILVKTEDFTETQERLFVSVPLNGVKADKADIYANDSYIKINFPPFFYEVDLWNKIDPEDSEAIVGDGCVKFNMKKQKKEKAIKKREEHYKMIQEQLNVERAEKARVENIKSEEKRIAEEGIQQWKSSMSKKKATSSASALENSQHSQKSDGESSENLSIGETSRTDSAIFDASESTPKPETADAVSDSDSELSDDDDLDMEAIKAKVRKEMDKLKVHSKPQPRESGVINVKFTSRGLFPTSTARETEDAKWAHRINQAWEKDAKSRLDDLHDPVSADEKNPIFLKEKGNAFLKAGNLHSAINAYTASLDLDPTLTACVTNRAICHLKLEDYDACIKDCCKAMDMIATEQERNMDRDPMAAMESLPAFNVAKLKLHVRRAAAFSKAGKLNEALKDYQCAVVLDPKNEDVKADMINIQKMLAIS